MKVSHLTNKILLIDTKNLVNAERGATAKILHHLKEIDRRKLYSDLRYSSLFDYCVRELGYSEASAQRRIVAARMLAEIPEIETKIESGLLSLTNISQVNQFFKEASVSEKKKVFQEVEGLSKKKCEKKLFELTGIEKIPKETKQRVSENKVKVAIVLSDDTLEIMEKVKALLGKDLNHDELIQYMAEAAVEKIEKKKFKQNEKPHTVLSPAKVGRVVSAAVKREVYKRDKKCTNCGSVHNLNFDHRHPYALGGPSTKENIRLLCFHCNQRARMKAGLNYPHTSG
jgi:hypothetical protein